MFERNLNWNAVLATHDLPKEVSSHLRSVYSTLTLSLAAAALGAWINFSMRIGSFLTVLASIAILVWFKVTPYEGPRSSQLHRVALLLSFALFWGASMAPFLEYTLSLKDGAGLILQALGATTAMFACFSGAALLSQRRSYLYLCGFLSSSISTLLWIGVCNLFFRSELLTNISLYFGLIVFSGFVVFDTQIMVEKAYNGDLDYAGHTLELFVDFVAIFIRILRLLSKKKRDE